MSSTKQTIPAKFLCPLTLNIMDDPLMTREGHSYERVAILTWLKNNNTSPLTRKPLEISQLVSNLALRSEIHAWRKLQLCNGVATDNDTKFLTNDDNDLSYDEVCYQSRALATFVFSIAPDDIEQWNHVVFASGKQAGEDHEETAEAAEITSGSSHMRSSNREHYERRTTGILPALFGRAHRRSRAPSLS